MNGTAELKMVSSEGLYLDVDGKGYFAAFKNFPYLADLPISQLFSVKYCGDGDIRWEEADIDLNVEILARPEDFPRIMHPVAAASEFGRKGGSIRSARKSAASRRNGSKGGRPRKITDSLTKG